ncbi:MAG: hypothetical protein CMH54_15935 [Myxococcales bacterium]|nr:hypothetical protein [Myxococcales bacterium]
MSWFRRKKKKARTIEEQIDLYRRLPRRLQVYREGVWLIVMIFGLGIAAINTGHNLLYLLLGFLLSIISLSGVLSERMLNRARVDFLPPDGLHVGETTRIPVGFKFLGRWGRVYSLRASPVLEDGVAETVPAYAPQLVAGERQRFIMRTRFLRRGIYASPRARLETDFPFGFVSKSRLLEVESTYRVWPRIHPVHLDPPTHSEQQYSDQAGYVSVTGEEFFSVREYRSGDPIKRIHWRLTARATRPVVRELELPGSPRLSISCVIPSLDEAAQEDAYAEMAASLAVAGLDAGYLVELETPTQKVTAQRGPSQRRRILNALAEEPASGSRASAGVIIRAKDPFGKPLDLGFRGDAPHWDLVRVE